MTDTYTCANCGNTYEKQWSDEEAVAERERAFPGMSDSEMVVVCDDCYKMIMSWAREANVDLTTPRVDVYVCPECNHVGEPRDHDLHWPPATANLA